MIRGVLIEGLSTSGKTSVFAALKNMHSQTPDAEKTMIAVSEHYSQVLHAYHGVLQSMNKDEHIQLLNRHVDYLEQQGEWIRTLGHTKSSNGVFYLCERFHLNHRAAFHSSSDIEMLERRLVSLNARCVLLTLSPAVAASRFVESRGEDWKAYVLGTHATAEEARLAFLEQQEQLRLCAQQSRIPTLEINTDDADWDAYARRILEAM